MSTDKGKGGGGGRDGRLPNPEEERAAALWGQVATVTVVGRRLGLPQSIPLYN